MNAPEKFLGRAAVQPATGHSQAHESARAQVAGSATYIDDIAEVKRHAARRAHPVEGGARPAAARGHRRSAEDARRARGRAGRRHPRRSHARHLHARRAGVRARHRGIHRPGRGPRRCRHGHAGATRRAQGEAGDRSAARHHRRARGREGTELRAASGDGAPRRARTRHRAGAAPAGRLAGRRRPGALLPGRPGRLRLAAGAGPVVDLLPHAASRRGPALGGARAGPGEPRGEGRMPAHGRRLRRQGNAGRPHRGVGRAGGAEVQAPGEAAPGPRRRLHGHGQAPSLRL